MKDLRRRRRGVAIIVVLGLISIALALSYTMMRAQGTTLKIQQNSQRRADARVAAISGLMAALGQLHGANWTGVGTTLAGQISPSESYTVEYSTGDAKLKVGDSQFAEWPYRLTMVVTGYAIAADGGPSSTHRLRAVARLVPRAVSASPPDWPQMCQFTAYQWTADDFVVEIPARVEGPVWMQGTLSLSDTYPSTSTSRRRYLSDLNVMRLSGGPDDRPFSGPISWRSIQTTTGLDLISALGVTTQSAAQKVAGNWQHPGAVQTYRLYPGGQEYTIPRLPDVLQDTQLSPDPQTNPLGLFVREGTLEVRSNVSVTGQLITTDDLFVNGQNVTLQSPDLRAIDTSSMPVRLPVAVVGDDFRVYAGAAATVKGAVLAWDEAEVHSGTETTSLDLRGRVVSKKFTIGTRTEWNYGTSSWTSLYDLFLWQLPLTGANHVIYFPDFMALLGRRSTPKIVLAPDTTPHVDHFPQPTAIYVPATNDTGLRWELIDWKDEG